MSVYKSGRKPLPDTGCICCCLLLGWFSLLKCKKMFTLPSQCFFFFIAAYYELQLYSLVKMLHWEATSESLTTGSLFKPLAVRVTACVQVCGRPALSMTVLEYCCLSMTAASILSCSAELQSVLAITTSQASVFENAPFGFLPRPSHIHFFQCISNELKK